jgi:hypothetical protein
VRLWTLHPQHLDRQGLLALWREGLLAQKVLRGQTRGYRNHPQLLRFQGHPTPVAAIATYLAAVQREAIRRGYHFDATKITARRTARNITATRGQLRYEWQHLGRKLRKRAGAAAAQALLKTQPTAHPLFRLVPGPAQPWEKVTR